jgi:hypothetical protein
MVPIGRRPGSLVATGGREGARVASWGLVVASCRRKEHPPNVVRDFSGTFGPELCISCPLCSRCPLPCLAGQHDFLYVNQCHSSGGA